YAFESNLTNGTVDAAASALTADTRIPRVDAQTDDSMTHLDILTADPAHNTFTRTAATFLDSLR
ncbi:alpha/beta hydrolase, partial [Streptomyces tateyamensis]